MSSAVNVIINGINAPFSGTSQDGHVTVPLRGVFEALGFHVGWEEKGAQTVTVNGFGYELTFKIGQKTFDVEDFINPKNSKKNIPLPRVPILVNGRTNLPLMRPLREVGCQIELTEEVR